MTRARNVVLVAREIDYRESVAVGLEARGYRVLQAADRAECARVLAATPADVVIADVQATGELSNVPEQVRAPIVALASGPAAAASRALSTRSVQVLAKPVTIETLAAAIEAAASRPGGRAGASAAAFGFTVRAPTMLALLEDVERLRDADCPVLVLGETGTGKTMLARHIHAIGARPSGNFVDLNCAGLSHDFFESELFGHERGAFTGAHAAKAGLLDVAHGGTLFLDEIGDIDLRVQPKILKVLEEKRYRRMGEVKERAVEVRLIAATHHDLLQSVAERTFRADLYYRISAIKLVVPPLRERREDIVPLAMEILARGGFDSALAPDAEERLAEHAWPGNVRELKNVVESAAILRRGQLLTADALRFDRPTSERSLPVAEPVATAAAPAREPRRTPPLLASEATAATRAELERAHIQMVLAAENGKVESAARRLGIPRSTLYWKLKRWGMKGGASARMSEPAGAAGAE